MEMLDGLENFGSSYLLILLQVLTKNIYFKIAVFKE